MASHFGLALAVAVLGAAPAQGGPDDATPPEIEGLSVSPPVFRVESEADPVASRPQRGAEFRFELSELARVAFTIDRRIPGRLEDATCRRARRAPPRDQRCTIIRRVGGFDRVLEGGSHSIPFSGRLVTEAGSVTLRPGSYRLNALAVDPSNNRSTTSRARFRVVR